MWDRKMRRTYGEFSVTIQARLFHGALWAARQRFGTNKALAAHLGVSQAIVGRWLALKSIPSKKYRLRKDWESVEKKLVMLTGQTLDDLFPDTLTKDFLDRPHLIELTRTIPAYALANTGLAPEACLSPEAIYEQKETIMQLAAAIEEAMHSLREREKDVLRLRFGLNSLEPLTLEQIGDKYGVGPERIRQIEFVALRKLRHPTKSRRLAPFIKL